MKIACLQTDIVWEDKKRNFSSVESLLDKAAAHNCDIACLPELFATGFTMNSVTWAEEIPGETSSFLAAQAKKRRMSIIGGVIEKAPEGRKPWNTCLVFDKAGDLICKYRKIHLFSLDGEDRHFQEGAAIRTFEADKTDAAVFICYDLRFPELFRAPAAKGAWIFFVPANWPSSRRDHWKTLIRARAIENQAYVVGVNRAGKSPFQDYPGGSMIIGPQGEMIAEGENLEDIVMGVAEAARIEKVRKEFPFLSDRKPALYQQFELK